MLDIMNAVVKKTHNYVQMCLLTLTWFRDYMATMFFSYSSRTQIVISLGKIF